VRNFPNVGYEKYPGKLHLSEAPDKSVPPKYKYSSLSTYFPAREASI